MKRLGITILILLWVSLLISQRKEILIPFAETAEFNILKSWNFEDQETGYFSKSELVSYFNNVLTTYSAPVDIVEDVINEQSTNAMRMTHWANDVWHGHTSVVPAGGPYDELYLSYNWKFGEDFNSTHGGKLPGMESHPRDMEQNPDCPRDGYGFICKINFSEANKIFTYHYDRTDHNWTGCPWSNVEYMYHPVYFNNGTWYNITQRIVINTFTNGVGNSDGIFEVWVDGMLVYQITDLRLLLSETPDIRANGFSISSFYGGSGFTYTPQNECYTYIDNVKVYIPTDDPVRGHNLHDPDHILETPDEIIDRRVYADELITESGELHNSEWGVSYSSCIDEAYLIDAGEGNSVIFNLDFYQIGSGDYLFFYDGNTSDSELIKVIKGYSYGDKVTIESSGRYLFVRMSVDTDGGASGFKGQVILPDGPTTPDIESPSVPTGLQASNINVRSMDLSWNASVDNKAVTGYRVYVNGSLEGSTTTTSYSLTQLNAETSYDLTVSAFDAASNMSPQSPPVTATTLKADVEAPSVPTGLQVTGVSGNSISLTWNPSSDNVAVSGYKIFVDGNPNGTSSNTTYSATGLSGNTDYSLTVSAFDVVPNESAPSEAVPGTTSAPDNEAPTVPTGIVAISITSSSISLIWDSSSDNVGVAGYNVYANGLLKGRPTDNQYIITPLNPGITYNIAISAYDAANNVSARSVEISVQTVNPDNTLDPTMPEVRTLDVKKSTSSVSTKSELTALGHTELQDYGILYSKERDKLEFGTVVYGDPEKDSVAHKERVREDLQLFYDFSEGRGNQILNNAEGADPFNLTINKPLNTYWLPGQGLKISGNTMIYGEEAPSYLYSEFSSSNEITLEAWLIPASLNQAGPVRILTLSSGNDSRAFSLMQEGNVSDFEYVVRLNTSTTDDNGLPEISTDHNFFSLGLHHVVYTRNKQGEEYIYVNSNEVYKGERLGNIGLWSDNNIFALANEVNQEREWNGTFYLVAVYSKAFDYLDVRKNYEAGFGLVHFTANLESLETNTSYYMSPFVRTDQGIVYGEVEQFMIQNVLHFGSDDSLDMAVVPNPSDGRFILSFKDNTNEEGNAILRIADMSGQIIYMDEINLGSELTSFEKDYDLSAIMRSGIYTVMLILGSRSKAQKLVIYGH